MSKYPNHIAIIMDGNGRWANQKNKPRIFGHRMGVQRVREIVKFCRNSEYIDILTLYTFSSENWMRPKLEIKTLMNLIKSKSPFGTSDCDEAILMCLVWLTAPELDRRGVMYHFDTSPPFH